MPANNGSSDPLPRPHPARAVTMSVCLPEPGTGRVLGHTHISEARGGRAGVLGGVAGAILGTKEGVFLLPSPSESRGAGQRGAPGTILSHRLRLPWSPEVVVMETDVRGAANQCGAASPAHLLDGGIRLGGDPRPVQVGAGRQGRGTAPPPHPKFPSTPNSGNLSLPDPAKGRCHPGVGPASSLLRTFFP